MSQPDSEFIAKQVLSCTVPSWYTGELDTSQEEIVHKRLVELVNVMAAETPASARSLARVRGRSITPLQRQCYRRLRELALQRAERTNDMHWRQIAQRLYFPSLGAHYVTK